MEWPLEFRKKSKWYYLICRPLPHPFVLPFEDAINAINYTVLWNPNLTVNNANFGLINTDPNSPRDFQLGLRFTFQQHGHQQAGGPRRPAGGFRQ